MSKPKPSAEIGERIRQARLSKNLSLDQLAGMLDVTRDQAQKWEAGRATPPAARRSDIAAMLGVTRAWLDGDGTSGGPASDADDMMNPCDYQ
jgi:transcriptional regulator with XRE-family HTH domain